MGLWAGGYLDIETKARKMAGSRGSCGMEIAVGLAYARKEAPILCGFDWLGRSSLVC